MPRIAMFPLFALLVVGCGTTDPVEPLVEPTTPMMAKGGPITGTEFATLATLPALSKGVHGEAYAVNQAGSIVAGYSWSSRDGAMHPVTWTLQNGKWTLTALPYTGIAGGIARGLNDQGDVAGNFWPGTSPEVVVWPASGGFNVLGCDDFGEGMAISAGAQVVAGFVRSGSQGNAAVWQPGSCRENLPPIEAGGGGGAYAINGDGTIVGGSSSGSPVRWRRVSGTWQIEQLDGRQGSVRGANSMGDLVGNVQVACTVPSTGQCSIGIIWYANGGSRQLASLGGESTSPRAINAAGEVVGTSTLANGDFFPFFWSETTGMRQLPITRDGLATAVSGVRTDGTRLVVGGGGREPAVVWVVRIP
jgi:probable HAF family extracellular repeat protein